jgi:hypothetical protein
MKTLLTIASTLVSAAALASPPACDANAPRSCGSWSSPYTIKSYCGKSKVCDGEWNPVPVSVTIHEQQTFRMCFLLDGTVCEETQSAPTTFDCDCY